VLATLIGKLVRDEYAALVYGYVSQECHLKFAEENHALCRLGKSVGSRAVEGGPWKRDSMRMVSSFNSDLVPLPAIGAAIRYAALIHFASSTIWMVLVSTSLATSTNAAS